MRANCVYAPWPGGKHTNLDVFVCVFVYVCSARARGDLTFLPAIHFLFNSTKHTDCKNIVGILSQVLPAACPVSLSLSVTLSLALTLCMCVYSVSVFILTFGILCASQEDFAAK